jgi:tetratricopeptide (TPR) repeat protein
LGHYKVLLLDYKATFLQTEHGKTYSEYIGQSTHAHNDFIQAAAEMGIVGITAMVVAMIMLIWKMFWHLARTNTTQRLFALLLYASAAVFFVDAMFNFPAHQPAAAFSVALMLGLAHGTLLYPVKKVSVKGNPVRALVAVTVVFAVSVNVYAYRDWQANVYLDEGINYVHSELYPLARQSLHKSLEWDVVPTEVLYWLAFVYQRQGDLDLSEMFYEWSMSSHVLERTYFDLAGIKENKAQYEDATILLDKLQSFRPDNSLTVDGKVLKAYIALSQGQYKQAQTQLELLRQDFDQPEVWYWLAQSLLAQGETKACVRLMQKALKEVDDNLVRIEEKLAEIELEPVASHVSERISTNRESKLRLRVQIVAALEKLGF